MENKQCNLKQKLEDHFKNQIGFQNSNEEFDKLIAYLNDIYKLSNVYDFNTELVETNESDNTYYKFSYEMSDEKIDTDTTIYIYLIFNPSKNIDSKNFRIVFDETTLGESDYPYGKTTMYLLDGTIKSLYFNYNEDDNIANDNNYIKQLIKK